MILYKGSLLLLALVAAAPVATPVSAVLPGGGIALVSECPASAVSSSCNANGAFAPPYRLRGCTPQPGRAFRDG